MTEDAPPASNDPSRMVVSCTEGRQPGDFEPHDDDWTQG